MAIVMERKNFEEHQCVKIIIDLNPVIKSGMTGVILEVFENDDYIVEFLDENGFNYCYEDECIFTINGMSLQAI